MYTARKQVSMHHDRCHSAVTTDTVVVACVGLWWTSESTACRPTYNRENIVKAAYAVQSPASSALAAVAASPSATKQLKFPRAVCVDTEMLASEQSCDALFVMFTKSGFSRVDLRQACSRERFRFTRWSLSIDDDDDNEHKPRKPTPTDTQVALMDTMRRTEFVRWRWSRTTSTGCKQSD